jgi:hypothetical protein
VAAATTMIAEDSPDLEACDGMLDARPTATMASPPGVAHDLVAAEYGGHELRHAGYPPSARTRPWALHSSSTREPRLWTGSLRLPAPPAVVAMTRRSDGARGSAHCTTTGSSSRGPRSRDRASGPACRRRPRTTDDPAVRPSARRVGSLSRRCGEQPTWRSENTAASSRKVRLVRSAAHVMSTRSRSERDQPGRAGAPTTAAPRAERGIERRAPRGHADVAPSVSERWRTIDRWLRLESGHGVRTGRRSPRSGAHSGLRITGGKTPGPSQPTALPATDRLSRGGCPHPALPRWLGETSARHRVQP